MKVNEEQNTQADRAKSPCPAQVEGLATPRPWRVDEARPLIIYRSREYYGQEGIDPIASVLDPPNAALIVRAVNAFDALVEAAKEAMTILDGDLLGGKKAYIVLKAAIKLAGGEGASDKRKPDRFCANCYDLPRMRQADNRRRED